MFQIPNPLSRSDAGIALAIQSIEQDNISSCRGAAAATAYMKRKVARDRPPRRGPRRRESSGPGAWNTLKGSDQYSECMILDKSRPILDKG